MDYDRVMHVIMICICHGWPWDIKNLIKKSLVSISPYLKFFGCEPQ